ncbi:MAG: hypothetical protein FWD46_04940 [Cystobacterineae bacterium]|nr:hypothetical protein [Cystobacterineae bacterium]
MDTSFVVAQTSRKNGLADMGKPRGVFMECVPVSSEGLADKGEEARGRRC